VYCIVGGTLLNTLGVLIIWIHGRIASRRLAKLLAQQEQQRMQEEEEAMMQDEDDVSVTTDHEKGGKLIA
jgi:hypothetical protein